MGATSSSYKSVQRNPTRNIKTVLTLNEHSKTYIFIQEMEKSLGEEQTLKTYIHLTGEMERISTDVHVNDRVIKGNAAFTLRTTKGRFETRWGDKFFQVKRGQLQLDLSKNRTYIHKASDMANDAWKQQNENMDENSITNNVNGLDSWESSVLNLQNDTIDDDRLTIVQNGANPTPIPSKNMHFGGRRRAGSSPGCLHDVDAQFYESFFKPKPEITVINNGTYMDDLLGCRNIEAMNNLLKIDLDEWLATFTDGALDMKVTFLSDEVFLKYHKPKFEYLWAQLQDENPILMSLCSLSYDDQQHQLYFPL